MLERWNLKYDLLIMMMKETSYIDILYLKVRIIVHTYVVELHIAVFCCEELRDNDS